MGFSSNERKMDETPTLKHKQHRWEPIPDAFNQWIETRLGNLKPALLPEPTINVVIFLALITADTACTYLETRELFHANGTTLPNYQTKYS